MSQQALIALYGSARTPNTYTCQIHRRVISLPASAAGLPVPAGARACAWSRGGDWWPWSARAHVAGYRIELLGWSHQPDQFPLIYAGLRPGTTLLDLPTAAGLTWWPDGAADLPGALITSTAGAAVHRYLGSHVLDRVARECGYVLPAWLTGKAAA